MYYFVHFIDRPDNAEDMADMAEIQEMFLEVFEDHIFDGPRPTDDGEGETGHALIVDFADLTCAEIFANGAPAVVAGLIEEIRIKPWKQVH